MQIRTPPVKSLFLDRGLNYHGGITKALLNLARSADPQQLSMEIGSLEAPSQEMLGDFLELGVPVHHLGDRGYLRPALALRKVLQSSGIQLLVCNSFRSYLIAKIAVVGLRVRLLFWIHIIGEIASSGAKTWVYRQISRRDTLIFITRAAQQANLPPNHMGKHYVIYYGIEDPFEEEKWRPYGREARRALGLAPDDLVLMYVGSFVPYKDQQTLVRAFDRLWARHPQLQLILIGRGERLEPTQSLAASLSSHDRIHFLGTRADARQLLGVADIYVHPAHPEAFGLAVAEAMLARLPVVGAADGGIPEIVQDGVNGLLFTAGSVDDLERKLESLIVDPAWTRRLMEAGRSDAKERFAPQRFADQMMQVLLAEVKAQDPQVTPLSSR